jgi:hypothetical protein
MCVSANHSIELLLRSGILAEGGKIEIDADVSRLFIDIFMAFAAVSFHAFDHMFILTGWATIGIFKCEQGPNPFLFLMGYLL